MGRIENTGNNNIIIQPGRDQNGDIIISSEHDNQNAGEEIAEYQPVLLQTFKNKKELLKKTRPASIISVLGLIVGAVAQAASIFSYFGIPVFVMWIMIGAIILGVWIHYLKYLIAAINMGIFKINPYCFGANRFEEIGGSVDHYGIYGKCPVGGCSGILNIAHPHEYPNEEGIVWAGVCDRRPQYHIFDFDENTLQGKRIQKLTPVKKQ